MTDARSKEVLEDPRTRQEVFGFGKPVHPIRPPLALRLTPRSPAASRAQTDTTLTGLLASNRPDSTQRCETPRTDSDHEPQPSAAPKSKRGKKFRRKRYTPSIPASAYEKLMRLTSDFAAGLKTDPDLAPALKTNPKGLRSDIEHLIRAQFQLKRGPHTDPLIDEACRLVRDKGKSVPQALRSQIGNWKQLDPYTRLLASKGLHQALDRRGVPRTRPSKTGRSTRKSGNQKSPIIQAE